MGWKALLCEPLLTISAKTWVSKCAVGRREGLPLAQHLASLFLPLELDQQIVSTSQTLRSTSYR